MATNFSVTLDTAAPASPTLAVNAGASYATAQPATANIGTADGSTAGYQIKVWGNVDPAANANIQATEGASSWIPYNAAQPITLSAGDGLKTISMRIRDDVWNETAPVSDSITLDTTIPVPNVTVGPDVSKVSKVTGKRTVSFTFQSDTSAQAWKVKVVPSAGSLESAGTTIPTTNGSTQMTGGALAATTPKACTIDGADLELASSGDGAKIVKVFVQDDSGLWSI